MRLTVERDGVIIKVETSPGEKLRPEIIQFLRKQVGGSKVLGKDGDSVIVPLGEVAKLMGWTRQTAHHWVNRGALDTVRIRRYLYVVRESFDETRDLLDLIVESLEYGKDYIELDRGERSVVATTVFWLVGEGVRSVDGLFARLKGDRPLLEKKPSHISPENFKTLRSNLMEKFFDAIGPEEAKHREAA